MTNIEYWLTSSADDLDTAENLFKIKKYHHSLFFVHLALEKLLKALIVSKKDTAPSPIHDLVRLAEKADLDLKGDIVTQLAEISTFNISARYDDYKFKFYKKATKKYAQKWLDHGNQLYQEFRKEL